ncbi:ABC transporter substrate-binding protein [Paraburkholderia domus]|uniref:ABC transporter substrate-binding protein n=1 Tax=Paraburkholderia domus TaxID=2793075 RepID=UPI001B2CC293|nr:ABC transporter substrate-binding protein [Paraburkholderia domus]CAE6773766.1 hypothetical protein R75483_04138 [Paraburkholderia domus]
MFVLDHFNGICRSRSRGRIKLSVVLSFIAGALLSPAFGGTVAPNPSTVAAHATPTHVRILRVSGDVVREGRWAFLITALNRTVPAYGPYVIDTYFSPMSAQREIDEVISGRLINVLASEPGHPELDAAAIPVPIPIDRGLLGYRVALINQDEQAKLDTIHDLQGLRTLSVGQGQDWGDVPVYRLASVPLVTASRYDLLFPMLADHRFDIFPRGVVEITRELKAFQPRYPTMRIDSHLLIRYPYAQFFYVSKTEPLLAKRIRDGLEAMLKDGSFEALFREHFGQGIADLHLERRVLIDLKNPLLPAWVPLDRKELWLDPFDEKKQN